MPHLGEHGYISSRGVSPFFPEPPNNAQLRDKFPLFVNEFDLLTAIVPGLLDGGKEGAAVLPLPPFGRLVGTLRATPRPPLRLPSGAPSCSLGSRARSRAEGSSVSCSGHGAGESARRCEGLPKPSADNSSLACLSNLAAAIVARQVRGTSRVSANAHRTSDVATRRARNATDA